jgi:glycerol kinase
VPDNGGVYLVPALSGLGAPHWVPEARAAIMGLSFAATRAHVVRARPRGDGPPDHDLMTAFGRDGARLGEPQDRRRHGANDWLAQDLADMLDLPVERPGFIETTASARRCSAGSAPACSASLAEAAAPASVRSNASCRRWRHGGECVPLRA